MSKNLKKFALVSEIVGGIGIVVSVLYLAYEISQNTANLKAANAMAISSEMNAVRFSRVQDGELDSLVRKGQTQLDSLSEDERSRFLSYTLVRLSLFDNLLYMDDLGLLPEGYGDKLLPGYCASLRAPGYRKLWTDMLGDFYSERLRQFMTDCYSE